MSGVLVLNISTFVMFWVLVVFSIAGLKVGGVLFYKGHFSVKY